MRIKTMNLQLKILVSFVCLFSTFAQVRAEDDQVIKDEYVLTIPNVEALRDKAMDAISEVSDIEMEVKNETSQVILVGNVDEESSTEEGAEITTTDLDESEV